MGTREDVLRALGNTQEEVTGALFPEEETQGEAPAVPVEDVERRQGAELAVSQPPGMLVERTNKIGLTETPPIRAGQRSALGNVKAVAKTLIRGLDAARMGVMVKAARKPEWGSLIAPMTLRAETPEGEEAFRAFPTDQTLRRRIQAVTQADMGAVKQAGLGGQLFQIAAIGGPLAAQAFIQRGYATGEIIPPSEEEIQANEAGIIEREDSYWFEINFPSINALSGRPLDTPFDQAAQKYIESKDGSQEAIDLVARVKANNDADGLVSESAGLSLVITKGLPMVGFDLAITLADPMTGVFALPVKGIKALTFADELERVGILPKLENLMQREAKLVKEMTAMSPTKALKQAKKASTKRKALAEELEFDPRLAKKVNDLNKAQGDLITKVRQNLDTDIADEAIAISASGRKDKQLVTAMEEQIAARYPNMTPENVVAKAARAIEGTAPVRAFRDYLKQHEVFEASTTGFGERYGRLKKRYEETMQVRAASEAEAMETLHKLVKDPEAAIKVVNDMRTGNMNQQKLAVGLKHLVTDKETGKAFKSLTNIDSNPLIRARRAIKDIALFEPKVVLGGTEVWRILNNANRTHFHRLTQSADFVRERFGFLGEAANEGLDKRLGMALDGRLVDVGEDGSRRYLYQVADDEGKILRSEAVTLTRQETEVADQARALFDEFAMELRDRGVKEFEAGKPIVQDYLPRLFDKDGLARGIIPDDMLDIVSGNVLFRHALPRVMRERLATEAVPKLSEAMEAYMRGAIRKLEFEPAMKEALKSSQALRPQQRLYTKKLINVLNGRPTELESYLNNGIEAGLDLFRKIPGVTLGELNRPAYRASLGISRAMHKAMLGGMLSSAAYNIGQTVNTASRFGPLATLKGFGKFITKSGRAQFDEAGIMDDFVDFFRNPEKIDKRLNAITGGKFRTWDDLYMGPMHAAEYMNRGIAFHTGMGLALEKRGIAGAAQFNKLDTAVKNAIMTEAIDAVETTQFIYGKLGMSPLFQQPGMRNLTTLVTFPAKQAQFMTQQMMDDPTGIARYLVMSGWITRVNREMLGIDVDHAFGFGFIPEDMGPIPIAGPEINLFANLWQAGAEEDPRERKRLFNEVYAGLGQLVAGAISGKMPAAMLGAIPARDVESFLDGKTLPGGATMLNQAGEIVRRFAPGGPALTALGEKALAPVGGLPELERDLGSRFATRMLRFLRQTADWEQRGPNNELVGTIEPQEAAIEAFGFRTEASSEKAFDRSQSFAIPRLAEFNLDEDIKNYVLELTQGDEDRAAEIMQDIVGQAGDNKIYGGQRIGSRIRNQAMKLYLEQSKRTLLSKPGIAATPAGRNILEQGEQ